MHGVFNLNASGVSIVVVTLPGGKFNQKKKYGRSRLRLKGKNGG